MEWSLRGLCSCLKSADPDASLTGQLLSRSDSKDQRDRYDPRRLYVGTADEYLAFHLLERYPLRRNRVRSGCPCFIARYATARPTTTRGPLHGFYIDVWPEMRPAVRRAVECLRRCNLLTDETVLSFVPFHG